MPNSLLLIFHHVQALLKVESRLLLAMPVERADNNGTEDSGGNDVEQPDEAKMSSEF